MDDAQYASAKAKAYKPVVDPILIPVWTDSASVGPLISGATTLTVSTSFRDYRTNGYVLVWGDCFNYEYATIASFNTTSITLFSGLASSYASATVAPLRVGNFSGGMVSSRGPNSLIVSTATFDIHEGAGTGSTAGFSTYFDAPILMDTNMLVSDHSEEVERLVEVFDPETSLPAREEVYDSPQQKSTVSWDMTAREEVWRVRQWLHFLKGRQKSFWLPTKLQDFKLAASIVSANSYIDVQSLPYSAYYGVRDIQIKVKGGAAYNKRVVSSTVPSPGVDRLNLNEAAGVNATLGQIEYICFLNKVRQDADRVEIVHGTSGVTIRVPVIEVPA